MTPTPKKLRTKIEQKFVDKFGVDFGTKAYEFVKKYLNFGGEKKKPGVPHKSLSQKRYGLVKTAVDAHGQDAFLKAMEIFSKKVDTGQIGPIVPYFLAVVKGTNPVEKEVVRSATTIPVPKDRKYNDYEQEELNWIYDCPLCHTECDPWDEKCPNKECDARFLWDEVKLESGN